MNLRSKDGPEEGGVVACNVTIVFSREELAGKSAAQVAALLDAKCDNARKNLAAFTVDKINEREWAPRVDTSRYYAAVKL